MRKRPKSRHHGLDFLRFAAIMLVFGRHMLYGLPDGLITRPLFEAWVRGGWIGVDLFFVLSGFLISGLLFTEYKRDRKISMGRFFVRRGWRIYPPFLVLIAFTVIHNKIIHAGGHTRYIYSELTFMQSYFMGLWWHTWSLSVEEHFYVLLPVAILVTLAARKKSDHPLDSFPWFLLALAIITLIVRTVHARLVPFVPQTHAFPSYLRMDSLGFGVAIAYYYNFHHERFVALLTPYRRWLVIGGTALLVPNFILELGVSTYLHTLGFTVNYIACGMVMVGILLSDFSRNRWIVPFATLGVYSYSIYLWHLAVSQRAIPWLMTEFNLPHSFWLWFAMYIGGALALGVAMALLVEMPALAIRDRFFPSRSSGAVAKAELSA